MLGTMFSASTTGRQFRRKADAQVLELDVHVNGGAAGQLVAIAVLLRTRLAPEALKEVVEEGELIDDPGRGLPELAAYVVLVRHAQLPSPARRTACRPPSLPA